MNFLKTMAVAATVAFGAAPAYAVVVDLPSPDFDGVSITETLGDFGSGNYELVNGSADAVVTAFGVTNPFSTYAYVDEPDDFEPFPPFTDGGFIKVNGVQSFELWNAALITETEWSSYMPLYGTDTLEDLFGAWSFGTDVVNWYEIEDASGLMPGQTGSGFSFFGPVASLAFGIGNGLQSPIQGTFFNAPVNQGGPAPVPLPGSAWLLMSGVAGLAGLRRMRRARA